MIISDPPEVLASAALLQATIIWISIRFGAAFWYTQRYFMTMKQKDRAFLSTGNRTVDRYLTISSVAIATFTTFIVSHVISQNLAAWSSFPLFGIIVGADVVFFLTVAGYNSRRDNPSLNPSDKRSTFAGRVESVR